MSRLSDRTAKKRLLQLADFLVTEKVSTHFNFGEWVAATLPIKGDLLKNADACGTQACALGWAPALPFAAKLGIKTFFSYGVGGFKRRGREIDAAAVAKILFGVTGNQFDALFHPYSEHNLVKLTHNSGPLDVARNIRKFVDIRFG